MLDVIKSALGAAVTFGLLDLLWLGYLMTGFYRAQLQPLARMTDGAFTPLWVPALLVYALLSIGVAVFVVPRAGTLVEALTFGALFGLMSFGVYDLTNYATLTHWTMTMTLVDMAWGAFACAMAAMVAFTVAR